MDRVRWVAVVAVVLTVSGLATAFWTDTAHGQASASALITAGIVFAVLSIRE